MPPRPTFTTVLLVRHGVTATTGIILPGRTPGLHLSERGVAQAERVALAARLGHLSLIVRAADTLPDAQGGKPLTTWGGDVSPALNQGRAAGRVMRAYQGTTEGKEFRF